MARKHVAGWLALALAFCLPLSYAVLKAQEGGRTEPREVKEPRKAEEPREPRGPGERPEAPTGPVRPGPRPPFEREMIERMGGHIELVGRMGDVCFNSRMAGLVAVGGMKEDVKRKPEETIKDLEDVLTKTRTLGLRNGIRLLLKDMYKAQGDDAKVLEHLKAMLAENDADIQAREPKAPK